jgi:hypothetical protein
MWHVWVRGERYPILVEKPEEKRKFGKFNSRWERNIKKIFNK